MLTNRATRLEVSKVTKHGTIRYVRYGFLLVFYSNFVPKTHRFSHIQFDLETRIMVTRGHRNRHGSIRRLLAVNSNQGPIQYRFRDKRRFQPKTAKNPTPCILCPR